MMPPDEHAEYDPFDTARPRPLHDWIASQQPPAWPMSDPDPARPPWPPSPRPRRQEVHA